MQPECFNAFTYPWFPNVASPDQRFWRSGTFVPPQPGFIMFRLPVMPFSSRTCTPSPFVNSTLNGNRNRPAYTSWNRVVPTQCSDDMTLSITTLIGPGHYTAPLGQGANVALSLGADNNTVTCTWTLGTSLPSGLTVQNVTIVVTDGPVFAADDPLYTGNPSLPFWQIGLLNVSGVGSPVTGSASALLTTALNNSVARSFTRVVDYAVDGVNFITGLPFTLTAKQPYVVETYGQGWLPYTYPMPGNYTYSSTPAPTRTPTQVPSKSPTQPPTMAPTQRPTFCSAPAPTAPPDVGFSVVSPAKVGGATVPPGSNTFSGYAAGSADINYDANAGLTGGWNNTNFEYMAPADGCVGGGRRQLVRLGLAYPPKPTSK